MNTNKNIKRILCYGDSNTYGYIPGTDHDRYEASKRWTGILQDSLGDSFDILEEGLNSRTICTNDPRRGKEGRVGIEYIKPCLDSHNPIDILIIMLGTNELKGDYNKSPEEIIEFMDKFLQETNIVPITRKILVSPPGLNEAQATAYFGEKWQGSAQKLHAVTQGFKELAAQLQIEFIDASVITEVGADGVHLTKEGHTKLAQLVVLQINPTILH